MTEIEREADSIVADWKYGLSNDEPPGVWDLQLLKASIVESLTRLSRPPAGFVRDDAGVDHNATAYVMNNFPPPAPSAEKERGQ